MLCVLTFSLYWCAHFHDLQLHPIVYCSADEWILDLLVVCCKGYYASMGGAHQRHIVVIVCVCERVSEWVSVSFREILFTFSPQSLNIKDWNVQCKLIAMLSWNTIGEFWIRDYCRVMAWFAHLDGCCQQSRIQQGTNPTQQAAYQHDSSICATNQTVTRVKYGERDCQSSVHGLSCLPLHITDHVQLKPWPNLVPTHAWLCCGLNSISW